MENLQLNYFSIKLNNFLIKIIFYIIKLTFGLFNKRPKDFLSVYADAFLGENFTLKYESSEDTQEDTDMITLKFKKESDVCQLKVYTYRRG